MRLLPCLLIVGGLYLVIATGYDQHRGVTSVEVGFGYATVTRPITIAEKEDPVGFRNVIVSSYGLGVVLLWFGVRRVWAARRVG